MTFLYYKTLGNTLMKIRNRYNLTKENLSSLLNIKLDEYNNYELGFKIPTKFLNLICSYYEIQLSEIVPKTTDFKVLWVYAEGTEGVCDGLRYFKKGYGNGNRK